MDSMRIYNSRVRGRDRGELSRASSALDSLGFRAHRRMGGLSQDGTSCTIDVEQVRKNLWLITVGLGSRRFRVVGESAATDLFDLLVWGGQHAHERWKNSSESGEASFDGKQKSGGSDFHFIFG